MKYLVCIAHILLSAILVLSLNRIAYAEAKGAEEECPATIQTSAYITYNETITQDTNLGTLYEDRMNKIKALPETGHFNNFKIVSQDIRATPIPNSNNGAMEVYINVSVDFDLNYKAVTDLNTILKSTEVNVTTYKRKSC